MKTGRNRLANTNESYDVAIVGGGAAGLSAALVLGRSRRRVVVIDAGKPRNGPAAHMHGYLSRDGMAPAELLTKGHEEIAHYGVELRNGEVQSIESGFVVRLKDDSVIHSQRILITTGLVDEVPDIEGIAERWGRDVLHCPYCHGWEVRDQKLGVIGTTADSVQHALLIKQWSNDVIFFSNTYDLSEIEQTQLQACGVEIVLGDIERLVIENDILTGVELVSGEVVKRNAMFVRPEFAPHPDGLLAKIGCELNDAGFPIVDATGLTSVRGVWVAGNAANPRAQVITAAGEGSSAAIAINNDLVQEDVSLAVERTLA